MVPDVNLYGTESARQRLLELIVNKEDLIALKKPCKSRKNDLISNSITVWLSNSTVIIRYEWDQRSITQ